VFDLFCGQPATAWLATKHALPEFRKRGGGSIVNISSLAAAQAYPLLGYKTMKAAMIAMTENVAAANAQYGIRVNAILPGLMNTPMAIENRIAQGRTREQVIAARYSDPARRKMGTGWTSHTRRFSRTRRSRSSLAACRHRRRRSVAHGR
jgi:NAD(P)-dependent dehydrogenase (short-subunit alcohol dehydrogenase family)